MRRTHGKVIGKGQMLGMGDTDSLTMNYESVGAGPIKLGTGKRLTADESGGDEGWGGIAGEDEIPSPYRWR